MKKLIKTYNDFKIVNGVMFTRVIEFFKLGELYDHRCIFTIC